MTFDQYITTLESVHQQLSDRAVQQINTSLTVRNWLIGHYIVEFELNGEDRAGYGQRLMEQTAARLSKTKGMTIANLFTFRNLYLTYPWFSDYILTDLASLPILQTLSVKLTDGTRGVTENASLRLPARTLLTTLSFSHFVELLRLDSELKRRFYEAECISNGWSVRELARATTTLLFERTGLSTDKSGVISRIMTGERGPAAERIRNPYVLEFLDLPEKAQYSENELEAAILNHIQTFLTELGRGFCFEARQRRITFGNTHYRIDLVFYHRILKCHILIDLKMGRFDPGDAGQMNLYGSGRPAKLLSGK